MEKSSRPGGKDYITRKHKVYPKALKNANAGKRE